MNLLPNLSTEYAIRCQVMKLLNYILFASTSRSLLGDYCPVVRSSDQGYPALQFHQRLIRVSLLEPVIACLAAPDTVYLCWLTAFHACNPNAKAESCQVDMQLISANLPTSAIFSAQARLSLYPDSLELGLQRLKCCRCYWPVGIR